MSSNILQTAAQTHTAYLHPGGDVATEKLLEWLELKPGQIALEIGCGTGATALHLAQTRQVRVVAFDRMPHMLKTAQRRLTKMPHERIRLVRADLSYPFPLPTSTFDAAYAESVLAIADSRYALKESARVVHPGGRFAFNERIWKPGISPQEAEQINALSLRFFGIPAATSKPWDKNDWLSHLHVAGFDNLEFIAIDDLLPPHYAKRFALRERLVHARAHLAHPRTYLQNLRYRYWGKRYRSLWAKLESILFIGTRI